MIPLYASPVLMVEQQRKLDSRYAHYRVLDGAGQYIAQVKEYRYYAKSSETDADRPQRFGVYGPDGTKLLTLDKPKQIFQRYVHVYQKRVHIGTITKNIKIVGSKVQLNDPRGNTLGEITGNWTGWDFRILRDGTEVAKIDKTFPGLAGMVSTQDKYALQFRQELPLKLRKLVVAGAIVVDQLLHEDRSDERGSTDRRLFGGSRFVDPSRPRGRSRRSSVGALLGGALSGGSGSGKSTNPAKKKIKSLAKKKAGGGKPKKRGGGKGGKK